MTANGGGCRKGWHTVATNEELLGQLEALRAEVDRLRQAVNGTPAEGTPTRVLSRRNLLRAAPIAAIGGAVAAMAATPAAAAVGDPVLIGHANVGAGSTTQLTGGTPAGQGGVPTTSAPAAEVVGGLATDWLESAGVIIGSNIGAALNVDASFLLGPAASFHGAAAPILHGDQGIDAVHIDATGDGTGLTITMGDGSFDPEFGDVEVLAGVGIKVTTAAGEAVQASSDQTVVALTSSSTDTSSDAMTIDYAGASRAFYAQSHNGTNINGTVTGVNEGHGTGVWGEQRNNTGSGFGVVGVGGSQGRGAQFTGGAAAVRLVPSAAATHPTTGKVGDLMVDSTSRLWFCTKAASGAVPATWKQIG